MAVDTGYVAPYAATIKSRVSKPVFVAGRINQPQIAEQVLASEQADMCGMTRAMICDPELANKSKQGRVDDIRACIGCNQACIGHFHLGFPISCIQHPETGRELVYGERPSAEVPKRVMVIGGGPGGMKAASVAAQRGHQVTLYERSSSLGGQALLAQMIPGRAEFGGIVTNLTREMELAGVDVVKNTHMTLALVEEENPDAVVVATGATPRIPSLEGADEAHVVDAWQVLKGEANVGSSVVVADWRADWIGLGVRDEKLSVLQSLNVEVIPMVRLFGVDSDTVYFQHVTNAAAIMAEGVDTLVVSQGHHCQDELGVALSETSREVHMVGDCLAPRTAEEAVLEGMKVALSI